MADNGQRTNSRRDLSNQDELKEAVVALNTPAEVLAELEYLKRNHLDLGAHDNWRLRDFCFDILQATGRLDKYYNPDDIDLVIDGIKGLPEDVKQTPITELVRDYKREEEFKDEFGSKSLSKQQREEQEAVLKAATEATRQREENKTKLESYLERLVKQHKLGEEQISRITAQIKNSQTKTEIELKQIKPDLSQGETKIIANVKAETEMELGLILEEAGFDQKASERLAEEVTKKTIIKIVTETDKNEQPVTVTTKNKPVVEATTEVVELVVNEISKEDKSKSNVISDELRTQIEKITKEAVIKAEVERIARKEAERFVEELEQQGARFSDQSKTAFTERAQIRILETIEGSNKRNNISDATVEVHEVIKGQSNEKGEKEISVAEISKGPTIEQEFKHFADIIPKQTEEYFNQTLKESEERIGKITTNNEKLIDEYNGARLEQEVANEVLVLNEEISQQKANEFAAYIRNINYPSKKADGLSRAEEKLIKINAENLLKEDFGPGKIDQATREYIAIRRILLNPKPVRQQLKEFEDATSGINKLPTNQEINTRLSVMAMLQKDPRLLTMASYTQKYLQWAQSLEKSKLALVSKTGSWMGSLATNKQGLTFANKAISFLANNGLQNDSFMTLLSVAMGGINRQGGVGIAVWVSRGLIELGVVNPTAGALISSGAKFILNPLGGTVEIGGVLVKKFGSTTAGSALASAGRSLATKALPKLAAKLGAAAAGLVGTPILSALMILADPALLKWLFEIIKKVVIFTFLGLIIITMSSIVPLISSIAPPQTGGGEENPTVPGTNITAPIPIPTLDPAITIPEDCPSLWPVIGTITQGPHGRNCSHQNMSNAIDIGVAGGTPIHAAHDGIAVVGANNIYGNYVDIYGKCNGTTFATRYAHMQNGSIMVENNKPVSKNQIIGLVDNTGNSTGNHLHFDLRGADLSSFTTFYHTAKLEGCCGNCPQDVF